MGDSHVQVGLFQHHKLGVYAREQPAEVALVGDVLYHFTSLLRVVRQINCIVKILFVLQQELGVEVNAFILVLIVIDHPYFTVSKLEKNHHSQIIDPNIHRHIHRQQSVVQARMQASVALVGLLYIMCVVIGVRAA